MFPPALLHADVTENGELVDKAAQPVSEATTVG